MATKTLSVRKARSRSQGLKKARLRLEALEPRCLSDGASYTIPFDPAFD